MAARRRPGPGGSRVVPESAPELSPTPGWSGLRPGEEGRDGSVSAFGATPVGPAGNYRGDMATSQINPVVPAQGGAGSGSTKQTHTGPRHPVRTALRGAGVFLDTAWRVVLLGGENMKD